MKPGIDFGRAGLLLLCVLSATVISGMIISVTPAQTASRPSAGYKVGGARLPQATVIASFAADACTSTK